MNSANDAACAHADSHSPEPVIDVFHESDRLTKFLRYDRALRSCVNEGLEFVAIDFHKDVEHGRRDE